MRLLLFLARFVIVQFYSFPLAGIVDDSGSIGGYIFQSRIDYILVVQIKSV